jgi:hypothetical protein
MSGGKRAGCSLCTRFLLEKKNNLVYGGSNLLDQQLQKTQIKEINRKKNFLF